MGNGKLKNSWRSTLYSLLFLTLTSASFLDDEPYCALRYRRLCQGKGRHVACQYPDLGPGPQCRNYTQIKFTPELKHFVINYINKRRQRIASGSERVRGGALIPKPQIMMMVVWDRELAYLAQRLADQCSFVHDDCRATVRYPYAGQTVGEVRWRGSSDSLNAQRAIRRVFDAWWGERRRVRPHELISPFKLGSKGTSWGHFSQLAVWALSAAGCGAARHGIPRRLLLVCDFSHTNMLGQSTLIPGDLAPCPARHARRGSSQFPLLCAPERKPQRNEEQVDHDADDEYATGFLDDDDDDHHVSSSYPKVTQTIQTKTQRRLKETDSYINEDHTTRGTFKNITKTHIEGKLLQQLKLNVTSQQYSTKKHHQGLTTRTYFGNIREHHENELILKAKLKMYGEEPYYTSGDFTTEVLRQKWKQSRQRPRRPGANALLSKPVEKLIRHSSPASMTLDREDLEQLYRDTGFHKHWKMQNFP